VAAHTSYTPAPEFTATVAPFRAWRGLRLVVAREPVQAAINHKIGVISQKTGCSTDARNSVTGFWHWHKKRDFSSVMTK